MSDVHPATPPVIAVTTDGGTHWLQCFADDMDADHGITIAEVAPGDDFAELAAKVAEHQREHGCGAMSPAMTPGQAARSRVSLEASEVSGDDWTEAMAAIDRDGETDPEMATQVLLMTPAEMEALYKRMKLYYEQGIWSTGTVGAVTAGRPATPAMTPGQACVCSCDRCGPLNLHDCGRAACAGPAELPSERVTHATRVIPPLMPPREVAEQLFKDNQALAAENASLRESAQLARMHHDELAASYRKLQAENEKLTEGGRQLERLLSMYVRSLYATWIDAQRGDLKAVKEGLSEGLDGFDGPEWDGTETGQAWLERTRGEEAV